MSEIVKISDFLVNILTKAINKEIINVFTPNDSIPILIHEGFDILKLTKR